MRQEETTGRSAHPTIVACLTAHNKKLDRSCVAEEVRDLDCEMIDAALVSLCENLDENASAIAVEWWNYLPLHHKLELAELTIAFQPWAVKLLPIGFVKATDDDLIDDLYEFHVNHETKGFLPFLGTAGRHGTWGRYTGLVRAIPLLDPDWPPYDDSLVSKSWEPQGKLRNADLGLDSPY